MCFLARYAIGAALSAAHRSPCEPHKVLTGGGWEAPGCPWRGARCKPGVTDALLSAIYHRGVWKGTNASRTKIRFFFGVRNWMCGVRACGNMQKRVSHGETVRVGSSVIIIRGNYGGIFCPPLSDIRGKIIFLRGSFALCSRVFPTLNGTQNWISIQLC